VCISGKKTRDSGVLRCRVYSRESTALAGCARAPADVWDSMTKPGRAILIAGPTASGKSALASSIARRLGGTVVNADSMQVYRELRILTARPTVEEEAAAPHELYGFVSGHDAYSAGRYAQDAAAAIVRAHAQERTPVIVGGTGLYFKVLLEGLSPVPPVDAGIRAHWRALAAQRAPQELHEILAGRDPAMAARLAPTDRQRMVRALEVLDSTGRSLDSWQQAAGQPVLQADDTLRLVVSPDRKELAARHEARVDAMLREGALAEVHALLQLQLSPELPVMRALGVVPLAAHLRGAVSAEEAAAALKGDTRRYAKRQRTWLKRHMFAWNWLNTQQMERIVAGDLSFIER
jgi:tRNA dimethylallyltransferase